MLLNICFVMLLIPIVELITFILFVFVFVFDLDYFFIFFLTMLYTLYIYHDLANYNV